MRIISIVIGADGLIFYNASYLIVAHLYRAKAH